MLTSGIIKACLEEASKSTYIFKVGCVIFKGKRIIGVGHNGIRSSKVHPKYKLFKNSLHAEQAALLGLDWSGLKGMSVLVMRIRRSEGKLYLALHCKMCQSLLLEVGIRDCYFSGSDGQIMRVSM